MIELCTPFRLILTLTLTFTLTLALILLHHPHPHPTASPSPSSYCITLTLTLTFTFTFTLHPHPHPHPTLHHPTLHHVLPCLGCGSIVILVLPPSFFCVLTVNVIDLLFSCDSVLLFKSYCIIDLRLFVATEYNIV